LADKPTKSHGAKADPLSLDFLKSHSLFGGLSDEQLTRIRASLQEDTFPKDYFIFREGDLGDRLYFIREGAVEIIKHIPGGEVKRLTLLGAGDTFGELELLDIQPRRASARTLEDTTTLTLTNKGLYRIEESDLKAFSLLIMNMAREIGRHLREYDGPPPRS